MIAIMDILIVIVLLSCISICICGWYSKYKKNKEWKKLYESIKVGDIYIEDYRKADPFQYNWGDKVEILDKAVGRNGEFYVKYIILDDPFDTKRSCSLDVFFNALGFEPYNNQDKQS